MHHSRLRNLIVTSLILFLSFLFSTIDSAAQIRLAWNPNSESDLAGYGVYYGTASRTYGAPINVGNVTSYTLTGLTPGVRYYFAVTAYDTGYNESGFSNEVYGTATETVLTPTVLSGATGGITGTSYMYTTGGSSSNLGHSVQYQFDWKGDGTELSAWGSGTQSKTWAAAGAYHVRARSRCATHTSVVSLWSGSVTVSITNATGVSYTVTTNPTGRQITVDGSTYTAPRTFSWTVGSSHTLSVSSPQNGASGTRYVYGSWSDGGAQTHTVTAPSSNATYTASFNTQYTLSTSVNPSGGGTGSPSGSNWYNSSQSVSVSATANAGYRFTGWSGDLSGSTSPASIAMGGPKGVVANFTPTTNNPPTAPVTLQAENFATKTAGGPTADAYCISSNGYI
ncbi:MAG: fibronectin type III domain-containing protein [Deltaproteobacteria bacterium]